MTRRLRSIQLTRSAPKLELVRPARRPHVLIVLRLDRPRSSWRALARGRRIARARMADVTLALIRPMGVLVDATRRHRLAVGAERSFRSPATRHAAWCSLLATCGTLVTERLVVRSGHPTRVVTEIVRQVEPSLIVVGEEPEAGGHWARVARRTNVPVLVARRPFTDGEIVAGTDFTDRRFPTFAAAVSVARERSGRVLLVHNVDPDGVVFTRREGLVLSEAAIRKLRDARAEQIHELAKVAGVEAHAVVTGNREPVTALSEHARRRDADIVIVGARPAPARPRPRRRTAHALIERLDRSVLVLPLARAGVGI